MKTFNRTIAKILVGCFLFVATTGLSLAQVTIGSAKAPINGALLHLKQNDELGVNSTKGLLLPRVNLTHPTNLYPMFKDDPNYLGNIDNKRTIENENHIGLIVYNINSCFNLSGKDEGIYIWDGSMWQPMVDPVQNSSISIFVDTRDGNKYRYRSFGSNAGVWMLDNMRAKTYDTNTTPETSIINLTPVANETDAGNLSNGASRFAYSNYSEAIYNTYPQLGLRYTWVAATGRNSPIANPVSEGTNDVNQLIVGPQGICPNGWHVPSDLEWNKLEQEIYNNAEAYSTYTALERNNNFTPSSWQTGWNTTASQALRGSDNKNYGHALAMFNSCTFLTNGTIVNNTVVGKSLSPEAGGLNIFLVFGDYSEPNKVGLYWTAAYSGSTGNNHNAFSRYLYHDDSSKTRRVNPTTKNLMYVRCKQDGT